MKKENIEKEIRKLSPQFNRIFGSLTDSLHLIQKLNDDLKSVNQEFKNIIESLPHGLITTNGQGKISHFNKAVAKFTQISPKLAIGKNINDVFKFRVIPLDFIKNYYQYQNNRLQFQYQTKEQELKDLAYNLVFRHQDGIIIHIEDVTLVNKLKKEKDRKNKLTTMGQMAATIAHEVRNPLASIELFASMLAKEMQLDAEKLEILGYIQQSVKTANYTISNLLQHTRPITLNKSSVNISKLLEKFYRMNQPIAKKRGHHFVLQTKKAKNIQIDEEMIIQVLNNLFSNSLQSMEKRGTRDCKIILSLEQKKDKVCIFFQDNGCGMSPLVQQKIFQSFYSTKNKGVGLGMSVVKSIIDLHQAQIFIDTQLDKGTKISLEFSTS